MPLTNRPILIVEDEKNDLVFMKMALQDAGVKHGIAVAEDGKEALAYITGTGKFADRKRHPLPYLVLLDLKLPHVMGLDVLKAIREEPQFHSIIMLVLTASSNPADIEAAYQLGANAYLVKPSSFDELRAMARSIKEFWLEQNQPAPAFA